MAEKAQITPEILKWARITAKITYVKAAAVISKTCKTERIKEWESPECKNFPTLKQVEKLARLYRRPLPVFFLPDIPRDFRILDDLRGNYKEEYSTALIFMMREIQEKQNWMSDFFSRNQKNKLDYVGKYSLRNSPEEVAMDIRKTLGIDSNEAKKRPLNYWTEKAENKRIFISLSSYIHSRLKLNSDEVTAFVISDKFAPFIFLNSEDWKDAQLFTLVYALALIWIDETGVLNETVIRSKDNYDSKNNLIADFCNEVAAHALLPENDIKEKFKKDISFKIITRTSKYFGVNNNTILTRAYNLDLISRQEFKAFKKLSEESFKEFLIKESQKKKSAGGPNYYVMQLRRNSKAFSHLLYDNYKNGKINGTEVSRLLNIKQANLSKLERYLYKQ
jgi:Zn-dependent peptidase ImmA (M78 family)